MRHYGINIALYAESEQRWVFTEPDVGSVHREPRRFALGGTRLYWERDDLRVSFDERTAVFGRPVRGSVRLRASPRFTRPMSIDPTGVHHWWAVAPSSRIEVELEQPRLKFSGSGYHDSNFGCGPLEDAFVRWSWSRASSAVGTAVLYDVETRDGASLRRSLLFRPDGALTSLEAPHVESLPRTRWHLLRSTRTAPRGHARVIRTLEDTPFYARSLLETSLGHDRVRAVHESLDLDRFRHPLVQCLLPFRIRRGRRA